MTDLEQKVEDSAPMGETVEVRAEEAAPDAQAQPEENQNRVPVAALVAERKKRQAEERKTQELQMRLQRLEQAAQPQNQNTLTDDEIFENLPGAFKKVQGIFDQRLNDQRYQMSEAFAREKYEDYDEVLSEYVSLAQKNPQLNIEVHNSANPAMTMYKRTKEALAASADPKDIETRIQKEVEKRVQEAMSQYRAPPSPSITQARGYTSPPKGAWGGPTPLSDILNKR